jgi:hypothetical protein
MENPITGVARNTLDSIGETGYFKYINYVVISLMAFLLFTAFKRSELPLTAIDMSRKYTLMPFDEFEKVNNIQETRNDIPREYLGSSPSGYYQTVDMDVEKLRKEVDSKLRKLGF